MSPWWGLRSRSANRELKLAECGAGMKLAGTAPKAFGGGGGTVATVMIYQAMGLIKTNYADHTIMVCFGFNLDLQKIMSMTNEDENGEDGFVVTWFCILCPREHFL